MFKFSSKTIPIRQYSLTRLLQLIKAGKEVKEDAKGILSITISNVLNNTTMNFTTESKVREIYIFKIVLSSKNIPTFLIGALDKTFEQLIDLGDGELESAFDIIEIFNNTSDTLPNDLPNWLNKLASGVVVPFRVIFNVIKVLISFTTGIFKFVFNPVFA